MKPSRDKDIVQVQIGRPIRANSGVVSRCHLGLPVVVKVPPLLDDGTPFPTLYWLTCPLAVSRIGRIEGVGGVKRMEAKAAANPGFAQALDDAHASYANERDSLLDTEANPRPSGGVGGTRVGVKCLHAHYAHTRGGGDNPVGALVADWIEPLDCDVECVLDGEINPGWVNQT